MNAILDLYENREKYNTLSKQALNSSKQFSVKYYGEKILEVYRKAINDTKEPFLSKFKKILRRKKGE